MNLSTSLVIDGKAGAQEMGDWAKGEFVRAGKKPNQDFVCIRFPGTQGSVLFNADQFVMFNVGDRQRDAQLKMAAAVEEPAFQIAFNTVKGSVPARTDVPGDQFDDCARKGMKDVPRLPQRARCWVRSPMAMPSRPASRVPSWTS